jgi:hypothetical protein
MHKWRRIAMKAHIRRVKHRLTEESSPSSPQEETSGVENLQKIFERISLKDVPLEDRRREANKPLYLIRYE